MRAVGRAAWLAAHPYLVPVGELVARIERALDEIRLPPAPAARWDAYEPDHREGVPVLESARAGVDPQAAGAAALALVERLAAEPGALAGDLSLLARRLGGLDDGPRRIAGWLLGDETLSPPAPGLLRCLGWLAAARCLAPLRDAYEAWRDEERWFRPHCPVCGSPPVMAQLAGTDPGRKRRLVCGACLTRWQFRRTQCPFCENDVQRLSTLAVEGEAGLRIDHCESCRGYLKTYDGEGGEDVLLADWTSLHLDLLAQERGLEKRAPSLFALDGRLPERAARAGAPPTVG